MVQHVLMDLDGTLTDSAEGITNSVMYALEKFGIHVKDKTSLYRFIGPPLKEELEKVYGFSEAQSLKALEYYREYFSDKGIFENKVYPGIELTLQKIRERGIKLVLATSKPEPYSLRILEHFDLKRYFDHVAGSTMDSSRVQKSDVIAYAIREFGIDPTKAVMVGDREHDVSGAAENQMDVIAVLYGYGSRQELESAGAKMFAETPDDILKYI